MRNVGSGTKGELSPKEGGIKETFISLQSCICLDKCKPSGQINGEKCEEGHFGTIKVASALEASMRLMTGTISETGGQKKIL